MGIEQTGAFSRKLQELHGGRKRKEVDTFCYPIGVLFASTLLAALAPHSIKHLHVYRTHPARGGMDNGNMLAKGILLRNFVPLSAFSWQRGLD